MFLFKLLGRKKSIFYQCCDQILRLFNFIACSKVDLDNPHLLTTVTEIPDLPAIVSENARNGK